MSPIIRVCIVALCAAGLPCTGCTRLVRPMAAAEDGTGQSAASSGDSADGSEASADSSGASADSSKSSEGSGSDGSNSDSDSGSGDGGGGAASATVSVVVVVGLLGVLWLAQLSRGVGGGGIGGPAKLGAAERDEALQNARAWLTDNRQQVRADIARGAGPFVEELSVAHTLPVALRPRLGAALQKARGALDAPLAAGAPSDAETERFAAALARAIDADPALASHAAALGERLAAESERAP